MLTAAVYGSCVARDVFRIAPDEFTVAAYWARSSWISTTGAPVKFPSPPLNLASSFQRRVVKQDYASTSGKFLSETECDVVMIDIVSERKGVYPVGDGWISESDEVHDGGWFDATQIGERLEFGTIEHLTRFQHAANKLASWLDGKRVWLIKSPFARTTVEGNPAPLERGQAGEYWDAAFEPYFQAAADAGFPILEVPLEVSVSSMSHQWGPKAIHYADVFYEWIAHRVAAAPVLSATRA